MPKWKFAAGLMALIVASVGAAKNPGINPLQKPYFTKVSQLSGGLVRALEDGGFPQSHNRIFSVDIQGNGSVYIASYGVVNRPISALPARMEIDPVLMEYGKRVLKKGELVIVILDTREGGKLTVLPFASSEQDMSVQIRPLRRKGKNRFIPYDAERCVNWIPKDRDAISWGDSGFAELIYFKKGWKHLFCGDGH